MKLKASNYKLPMFKLVAFLLFSVFLSIKSHAASLDSSFTVLEKVELQIQQGAYEEALKGLRTIFSQSAPIPDEVAYLYGRVMLGMQNYTSARDAFQKYIELKGEQGKHYSDAVYYKDSTLLFICSSCDNSGKKKVLSDCIGCAGKGKTFVSCSFCRGAGSATCSSCLGKGIIQQTTNIGTFFEDCLNCSSKGYVPCQRCHGARSEPVICDHCSGTGKIESDADCTH